MADIYGIIDAAAKRHGVPTEALLAIAQIESRMNPHADNPNSSASGLFQFTSRTAREYGLTGNKRNDIAAQADAAARMAANNSRALGRALGRSPTPGELYLAHQQGLGGATALLRNPDKPAAQVLSQFYGGNAANVIAQNGGNPNMSAGQFAGMWVNKGNAVAGRIPPAEMPQVASAVDVINRVAPTPAMRSPAMGYAPPSVPMPPAPIARPERQRTAPVPATQSLPLQSIRAANAANRPALQSALESHVNRAPTPATPSRPTQTVRAVNGAGGNVPLGRSVNTGSIPIGLMQLAAAPNAATPRLQADGSVRSPMSAPPVPADVFDRTTARNTQIPAPPPMPRSRPPRLNSYEGLNYIADAFAATPPAPPALQTALNNRAGLGAMPSMADMAALAGTKDPERLAPGIDQFTEYPRTTQVAQTPPLPRARPQTGVGGPLPPIAPPMPPTVPKVAPVPAPRLQRPGIFGTPKIGNWEVPLPGILGTVQNITAAMNNAGGPFNNGADNALYNVMRGGNFANPGGGLAQSAGFRYAQGPNGWVNVGAVNPSLTPAQRYTLANAANRGLGAPSTQGNWLATSGGAGASESSGEGNYTPWMAPGSTAERLAKLKEQHSK